MNDGTMHTLNRTKALALLAECTGDDIWSAELCREKGIPEVWIEDSSDCYESGFESDSQTIYEDGQVTNHYFGFRDVDLAYKLGEYLGVDVKEATRGALGKSGRSTGDQGSGGRRIAAVARPSSVAEVATLRRKTCPPLIPIGCSSTDQPHLPINLVYRSTLAADQRAPNCCQFGYRVIFAKW